MSTPRDVPDTIHTANASKRIEKYFVDFRNLFPNQENIRKLF